MKHAVYMHSIAKKKEQGCTAQKALQLYLVATYTVKPMHDDATKRPQ